MFGRVEVIRVKFSNVGVIRVKFGRAKGIRVKSGNAEIMRGELGKAGARDGVSLSERGRAGVCGGGRCSRKMENIVYLRLHPCPSLGQRQAYPPACINTLLPPSLAPLLGSLLLTYRSELMFLLLHLAPVCVLRTYVVFLHI